MRPGLRIARVGDLEPAFLAELAAVVPNGAEIGDSSDLIFLAAEAATDLDALPGLAQGLAAGGAIWVVARKGRGAPVKDAEVRAAGRAAGLVDIKVCGFSDTHTALKFSRRRA